MGKATVWLIAWGFWLGLGPALLFDYGINTWQWWAFVIPLQCLIQVWRGAHDEETWKRGLDY